MQEPKYKEEKEISVKDDTRQRKRKRQTALRETGWEEIVGVEVEERRKREECAAEGEDYRRKRKSKRRKYMRGTGRAGAELRTS